MSKDILIVNEKDNVATALVDLPAGKVIVLEKGGKQLKILDEIAIGHKFALSQIDVNQNAIKYGEVIGVANVDIKPGNHVHVHNIDSTRGRGDKN
ncbi:MAG: UxaA family hydrolase [Bacillota bacterium]|nr:UxaA family hydrolase [Bacillota bacterium]